jgi:hypothetical protein
MEAILQSNPNLVQRVGVVASFQLRDVDTATIRPSTALLII